MLAPARFAASASGGAGRPMRHATARSAPAAPRGLARRRAARITASGARAAAVSEAAAPAHEGLGAVQAAFQAAGSQQARLQLLQRYAQQLPPLAEEQRTWESRVAGCTTQVWLAVALDGAGCVQVSGDSDSQLSRGLCAVVAAALSGMEPQQLLEVEPKAFACLALGPSLMTPGRTNGFLNMLEAAKTRTRLLTQDLPRFPSLRISADAIEPQGRFAEAQAEFLQPDAGQVERLVQVLEAKRIGVVAHFYMDPQVQGVLTAAGRRWPHVHISDSLVMADRAVKMAEAGCASVAVLGVDFMSENVRAILDEAGHTGVQVYRMDGRDIGCSLAEAAESAAYEHYLAAAAADPHPGLHVVYINTSLRTKAHAHAAVPTLTCTSGNVVPTILQAFAQVPDLRVWYGPDTYMGRNIAQLLASLAQLSDAEVAAVHSAHTQASVRALLPRLHYFEEGTCIVHHIFGAETTGLVRRGYGDALLTAHFEVPGEMFELAMEARARGRGVVGSTSDILAFIARHVIAAAQQPFPEPLQVVLGTEAGLITAIVDRVQALLREARRPDLAVEVVFPVAPDAITSQATAGEATLPGGLALVPGPAAGEGCSTEGGCASCPYMKMNTLEALLAVCERVGTPGEALLEAQKPRAYAELVGGRSMASLGCEPILHMRGFQRAGALPDALVADILARAPAAA